MKMNIKERRLRLWKARQEAEGYDVSKVHTLEDAEKYFDKKRKSRKKQTTVEDVPEAAEEEALEMDEGEE